MTVLQIISSGGYYGAENMLVTLSASLREFGCRSVIAVFENAHNPHTEVGARARELGIETASVPCRGRLDRSAVARLVELAQLHGAVLLHTHGSKANTYGWLAGRRLGIPRIATYHGERPERGLILHLHYYADRLVLQGFDRVVGVSDAIVYSLRRGLIPAGRLLQIENGIDFSRFRAGESRFTAHWKTAGRTVIGVVGRLDAVKGHTYLIQAIPHLVERYPEALFVFVGDGPLRAGLEAQVQSAGIGEFVVFAGSQTDMPDVYAGLDLLVMPSLSEGMPMTIIEALASACPVIASRVGAIPELVVENETGMLVAPGNADDLVRSLVRFFEDRRTGKRLGQAGRERAMNRFSAVSMARRYSDTYCEVLGSRANHARPDMSTTMHAELNHLSPEGERQI